MFAATDTAWAPWYVARTDDKKRGRLNLISHLLSQVPYKPLAHKDVTLPKRQPTRGYGADLPLRTASPPPERAPDPARRRAGRGASGPAADRLARGQGGGVEIVLVHRPADDDWSFPKGKLHPGETEAQAALREVQEETSLGCRPGREVGTATYRDPKVGPRPSATGR